MSAEIEVQRMLSSALSGIGLTVYDFAPQAADGGSNAKYPYVEIGAIILSEWDTATELGFNMLARIHTRSRSAGAKECKVIQGQIYAALHRTQLPITGQNNILMMREMSDCTRIADGTFHGVCEYRALIQAT